MVIFASCMLLACLLVFSGKNQKLCILTDDIPEHSYIGSFTCSTDSGDINIRVLCLKHCLESMADGDSRLVIQAANLAKSKGLNIADIGDFYINRNGQTQKRMVYDVEFELEALKKFIGEQMKINAASEDTLIVYTVGHGSPQGDLQTLGKRAELLKILAECAAENHQRTLWWQLSCYASAKLPPISSLTPEQQDLFTMVASSDERKQSMSGIEGKIMEKVFLAMVNHDPALDANKDDTITAGELSEFLRHQQGNGDFVFAKNPEAVVFGGLSLARRIPIVDHSGSGMAFPKNYIPMPNGR